MMAPLADPSPPLGYHVVGSDGTGTTHPTRLVPVGRGQWRDGPIPLAEVADDYLRPQLAVVLAEEVRPGTTPGAAFLAVAGRCLAVTVVDTAGRIVAVLAAQRLLEPSAGGPVALFGPTGSTSCDPAADSDVIDQLQWLASSPALSGNGFSAGQMVIPIPRRAGRPLPAAAGTWQLTGPEAAVVSLTLTAPA